MLKNPPPIRFRAFPSTPHALPSQSWPGRGPEEVLAHERLQQLLAVAEGQGGVRGGGGRPAAVHEGRQRLAGGPAGEAHVRRHGGQGRGRFS